MTEYIYSTSTHFQFSNAFIAAYEYETLSNWKFFTHHEELCEDPLAIMLVKELGDAAGTNCTLNIAYKHCTHTKN